MHPCPQFGNMQGMNPSWASHEMTSSHQGKETRSEPLPFPWCRVDESLEIPPSLSRSQLDPRGVVRTPGRTGIYRTIRDPRGCCFLISDSHTSFIKSHMSSKVRAYLKVHGGPAPQCAPSSWPVADRGGDGVGQPMNSCYSWYTNRARPRTPAVGISIVRWWSVLRFFYHIGSVAYLKCTVPGVETMAPAALFFLFLIEPNTLAGHFEGVRRNGQVMDTSLWHYSGQPPSHGFPGGRFEPRGAHSGWVWRHSP